MRQKTVILVLFTTIFKLASTQGNDVCYPNEVLTFSFNPCNTCEIRSFCPDYSGPGCDCAPGLFRNSEGACVPPEACDAPYAPPGPFNQYGAPPDASYNKKVPPVIKCTGEYEEFSSCSSACPPACERYTQPCTEQCVPGCLCSEGYIRNKQGACVKPEQCENRTTPVVQRPPCGASEEYTECGTACPPTCSDRFPVCSLQCVRGCFCRRGYVRKDGRCVPPQECEVRAPLPPAQQTCRRNEVFSNCGSSCPPTCENPRPQACTQQCVRGCFCRQGYVRSNGICVLPQECTDVRPQPRPPHCGANEVFINCGTACPATCQNPRPPRCTLQCVSGCFCRNGYVRQGRRCVRLQECRISEAPSVVRPLQPTNAHSGSPPSILGRSGSFGNPYQRPFEIPPPRPAVFPPRPAGFPPPRPFGIPPPRPGGFPPPRPFVYPPPPVAPAPLPPAYPISPPPAITKAPPPGTPSKVCPDRFRCNRFCREDRHMQIGFCIGADFSECQCWG